MMALTAYRARGIDSQHVPNGPVILAPNHASFMDHFFTGAFIRRRIQFMAKSQLFKPGILTWIFSHGGVFPVRRGLADEEAFITSFKILERGGAIVMYCEGGRSRTGKIGDEARPGNRPAGDRVGRPGRPRRDPRLSPDAQLEAAELPARDRPLRRRLQVSRSPSSRPASSSSRRPTTCSSGSRSSTQSSRPTEQRD